MPTEASLKGELTKRMRQELLGYVVLRHEDKSTYGIPDWTITGQMKTAWLEGKYADPDFTSNGIQDLTMRRLGNISIAYYIIFEEFNPGIRSTRIVHPRDYLNWRTSGEVVSGFDHEWVIAKVREMFK